MPANGPLEATPRSRSGLVDATLSGTMLRYFLGGNSGVPSANRQMTVKSLAR